MGEILTPSDPRSQAAMAAEEAKHRVTATGAGDSEITDLQALEQSVEEGADPRVVEQKIKDLMDSRQDYH